MFGEVLVEFFELDKHPYHREMEDMKRAQRKKKKALKQQEDMRQAQEASAVSRHPTAGSRSLCFPLLATWVPAMASVPSCDSMDSTFPLPGC